MNNQIIKHMKELKKHLKILEDKENIDDYHTTLHEIIRLVDNLNIEETTLKEIDITFITFEYNDEDGLDCRGSCFVYDNNASLEYCEKQAELECEIQRGTNVINVSVER